MQNLSYDNECYLQENEMISVSMALQLAPLRNRGLGQLGNFRKWSIFQHFSGGAYALNPPSPPLQPPPPKDGDPCRDTKEGYTVETPIHYQKINLKAVCNHDREVQKPLRGFEFFQQIQKI